MGRTGKAQKKLNQSALRGHGEVGPKMKDHLVNQAKSLEHRLLGKKKYSNQNKPPSLMKNHQKNSFSRRKMNSFVKKTQDEGFKIMDSAYYLSMKQRSREAVMVDRFFNNLENKT